MTDPQAARAAMDAAMDAAWDRIAEQNRRRLTFVTEVDLLSPEAGKLPVGVPLQVSLRSSSGG